MGQDNVCLISGDPSTCVNGFNFFMISSETGLYGLDGILGLSPSSNGNGPSYMWALYSQGLIAEPTATFWINDGNSESSVTLGGLPPNSTVGETLV